LVVGPVGRFKAGLENKVRGRGDKEILSGRKKRVTRGHILERTGETSPETFHSVSSGAKTAKKIESFCVFLSGEDPLKSFLVLLLH
jgi:hypothetical protein